MIRPISDEGVHSPGSGSRPASLGYSRPVSALPQQGGIRFPREDPFASAAEKTSRTAPEGIPIEPSLLPEEDEYFSFEI